MDDNKEHCIYCNKVVNVVTCDQRRDGENGSVIVKDFLLDCGHAKTRELTFHEIEDFNG